MTIALDLIKKIPANVNARQVTAFNIAAFGQHTCEASLKILWEISSKYNNSESFNPSPSERFEILSRLWTIIDALDAMRAAINSEKAYLKFHLDDDLAKRLIIARKMRNYKSHISENINNVTSKSKYFPPLGLAKWFIVNELGGENLGKIYVVSADARFSSNSRGKLISMSIDVNDGADGVVVLNEPSFALQTDEHILNLSWTVKLAEKYFMRVASEFEDRLILSAEESQVKPAQPLEGFSILITAKR